MPTLNITLPPDVFAQVQTGEKRTVATRRNPRKDRYFAAKTPEGAMINGHYFPVLRVEGTETEWIVHI